METAAAEDAVLPPPPTAPPQRSRRQRLTVPLVIGGVVLAGSVALHVRDPHQEGSWGSCLWRTLTGTDCPGCGGSRAVNDLTNLRFADAASSNLLFFSSLPFIGFFYARMVHDAWFGVERRARQLSAATWSWLVAGTIIGWWIVRNLPGLDWLQSGPV